MRNLGSTICFIPNRRSSSSALMASFKPYTLFHFRGNGPFLCCFQGNKPGIYMAWHECSEQVLGIKNAIYKKYNNYDIALSDFNSYFGAPTPSTKVFPTDGCQTIPPHPGNHGSWKKCCHYAFTHAGVWSLDQVVHVQQL